MTYTIVYRINNEEAPVQYDLDAANEQEALIKARAVCQGIADNGTRVKLISVEPKSHGGPGWRAK